MTENTGYAAFALYNALKLHFTSDSYDFFKYHGKTNISKDSFLRRKDKYTFYKLSRKYSLDELKYFYVSNFLDGDKWVGDMNTTEGEEVYKKWMKTQQSLSYQFQSDVSYLFDKSTVGEDFSPNHMFKVENGSYPVLLMKTMNHDVTLETLCIMNAIFGFFGDWEKKIVDDVIWPNYQRMCTKYTPFIEYDSGKFKDILREKAAEYA